MEDKFWIHDFSVLIRNYHKFIPTKNMNNVQQYNAITLFCLYSIVLLIIFKKPIQWIYLPLSGMILIILLYMIKDMEKTPKRKFPDVEVGHYDSNGNLLFEKRTEGFQIAEPEECKHPTVKNPFMNPLQSDYTPNQDIPVACNSDDEKIKNEIAGGFNSSLFMDVDDVFEQTNSQRQFFTVTNTSIPSNQTDFANWLYKCPSTCKEDQEQCLRWEDLRYKR